MTSRLALALVASLLLAAAEGTHAQGATCYVVKQGAKVRWRALRGAEVMAGDVGRGTRGGRASIESSAWGAAGDNVRTPASLGQLLVSLQEAA